MFTGILFYCFVLFELLWTSSGAENTQFEDGNTFCTKDDLLRIKLVISNLSDKVLEQKNEILEQKDGILEQKRDIIEQKNEILEQKNEIFQIKTHLTGQIITDTNIEDTSNAVLIQEIKQQLSIQNETLHRQTEEIDNLRRGLMSLQQQLHNSYNLSCPNGSIEFQQTCYWLYDNEKLTWSQSVAYCKARNSSLVILETMAEYDFLVSYMKASSKEYDYWIAGTDADEEGVWTWAPSGSPAEILPWATDQPNSYNGNQDCAEISPILKFGVNDDNCLGKEHPLCEMNLVNKK